MIADYADPVDAASMAVRFFHFEKTPVALRAGLDAERFATQSASLAGVTPHAAARMRAEMASTVADAAAELAERPAVRSAMSGVPFARGDVIVALGDSITDDLLSWAYQLERVLELLRPDLALRVVNQGITGHTTQEAISRFDLVAAARPAWIIQLLGTNDARRHGGTRLTTTSLDETERNLGVIRRFVETDTRAQLIVMTPPPADQAAIEQWAPFHEQQITWLAEDIDRVAALVRDSPDQVVDIHELLSASASQLLLPDGLHPNLLGQQQIAEAVLLALPDAQRRP
jgi:lysophospholipase L1-like esterase